LLSKAKLLIEYLMNFRALPNSVLFANRRVGFITWQYVYPWRFQVKISKDHFARFERICGVWVSVRKSDLNSALFKLSNFLWNLSPNKCRLFTK
jgi:hypothetical protein